MTYTTINLPVPEEFYNFVYAALCEAYGKDYVDRNILKSRRHSIGLNKAENVIDMHGFCLLPDPSLKLSKELSKVLAVVEKYRIVESRKETQKEQIMSFSTNRTGTIKDCKEHIRNHHSPGDYTHNRIHDKARAQATEELSLLEEKGKTHASVSVSGSTWQAADQSSISYSVTVSSYDPPIDKTEETISDSAASEDDPKQLYASETPTLIDKEAFMRP